ncbi:HD-GYP domain-containing protein [bacterium]|nr:HD-GYP domain-containing protein [bacterium]
MSEIGYTKEQLFEILKAVINAIEEAEGYAQGHSQRVLEYAMAIAKHLEPPYEDPALPLACLLHDIGMLGIPIEITLKPARLTNEERALLERHPLFSVQMLQHIQGIDDVLKIIRHHHEAYDGTGYPDGIAREEIPLGARILAVADAFEAMTCRRPHRWPLPLAEALTEIRRNSGRAFDPKVVDALLKAWQAREIPFFKK